jgi:hypothetical protein
MESSSKDDVLGKTQENGDKSATAAYKSVPAINTAADF